MVEIIDSAARDAVERARLALEDGGVVLVPTDTVYGLAVSPLRDDAAVRLFAIKRRPRSVNLPVMVASGSDLETLGVTVTCEGPPVAGFGPGAGVAHGRHGIQRFRARLLA